MLSFQFKTKKVLNFESINIIATKSLLSCERKYIIPQSGKGSRALLSRLSVSFSDFAKPLYIKLKIDNQKLL